MVLWVQEWFLLYRWLRKLSYEPYMRCSHSITDSCTDTGAVKPAYACSKWYAYCIADASTYS